MGHYIRIKENSGLRNVLIATLFALFTLKESFAIPLGDVQSFAWSATDKRVDISVGTPKVRIIFYKSDIFRIWVSSSAGSFSDASSAQLVVWKGEAIAPTIDETNPDYYLIKTNECALRVYKKPCKFSLYDAGNTTPVFEEASPINLGSTTVQSLTRKTDEHFYGCGAWNGHYCLTNLTAPARYGGMKYENGNSPNPAPMYVSRLGYGAFRNTWDNNGSYGFQATVTTSHGEDRFDCFYFYGPSLKKVLRGYTDITGKINFPPIWALELGAAGRYDASSSPYGLAEANAAKAATYDIPFGWWLPNDSYSSNLDNVQARVGPLKAMNEWCGAWCGSVFSDITNRTKCVRDWGVRGFKLDCSWIGAGGIKAFNALTACGPEGLEALSSDSARSYQWTTAGWAGTQRISHAWTGDQSCSMEWLRWHIPTMTGACMSAMNGLTVDLAAIFDGSDPEMVYVRCWQYQMWVPFLYLMDCWSDPKNRLPWNRCPSYIEPILKPSMKLKTRLAPYAYTLLADAYETGVSVQRPPMLEFPDDRTTWDEGTSTDTKCKQEFMMGPWFLIRPVYEKTTSTNTNIIMWLPGTAEENWIDYYTGKVSAGAQNVTCDVGLAGIDYDASKPPKVPVWVREGAIVPMWPAQYWSQNILIKPNNPGNTLKNATTDVKGPWTIDVYPHRSKVTSFSMYEDDGLTREYKRGRSARTLITSDATQSNIGRYFVTIGAAVGDYTGKPAAKTYIVTLHTGIIAANKKPVGVKINNTLVAEKTDSANLGAASEGWWWNTIKNGIVYVKTQSVPVSSQVDIVVDLDVTGIDMIPDITGRDVLNKFSLVYSPGKVKLSFANMFTGQMTASIYTMQGRLIVHQVIDVVQSRAELRNFAVSGSYIMQLERNGRTVSRKFYVPK